MRDFKIYPKQFKNEKIAINKNKCFMLMQFTADLDLVYGTIKDELDKEGYLCSRADDIEGSPFLFGKILNEIFSSRFIIADLTHNNPNVFYELGIAHSFKDPSNIILLKQKHEKCPFDISYLRYIEYSPDNLKYLIAQIKNHIKSNKYLSDFYEMLNVKGIITLVCDNQEKFVEYIKNELGEDINALTELISNGGCSLDKTVSEQIFVKYENLIKKIIMDNHFDIIQGVLNIYYELILSCSMLPISEVFVNRFLNQSFNVSDSISWKTDLVVKLAENRKLLNISLPWIMNYFSQLHATTIDLNRYKLEKFLMTSNYVETNESIINAIFSDNCYLREYMADIIGEKRLSSALESLYIKLETEENCYVSRSIVQAIGKIDNVSGINRLIDWFSRNVNKFVERKYWGIFKHMSIALARLDTTAEKIHYTKFINQYSNYLSDYIV